MSNEPYIIRRLSQMKEDVTKPGYRRRFLTAEEFPDLSISHFTFRDAKLHHHLKCTEFYYVTEGKGQMELAGETFDVEPGDLIQINPPTKHRPIGTVSCLVFCSPGLNLEEDVVLDE